MMNIFPRYTSWARDIGLLRPEDMHTSIQQPEDMPNRKGDIELIETMAWNAMVDEVWVWGLGIRARQGS